MQVPKSRLLLALLLVCLVPVGVFASGSEGTFSTNTVDLGQQKVTVLETIHKGAYVRLLPADVQDPVIFDALNQEFSRRLDAQMSAKAEEARIKAEQSQSNPQVAGTAPSGGAKPLVVRRSGSDSGWNGSGNSYSYHSGYLTPGFWTVSIDATGLSSGDWRGSGKAQQIILHEQLCFSGAAITISWPPALTGSSSCGNWESAPFTGTNHASASYGTAHASSWVGLFGSTQSDSATVRINYHDYRPMSHVSLSYWGY